ncbi:MAG: saccharopine dehydrogenase NADP-binding domain-containing protein [Saprospiraceae bacterium]
MKNKKYELIIWGASGFTGQLVAEYLLQQYGIGKGLNWAIAGRNKNKLENIRAELGDENIPILTADSLAPQSINALVQQTNVICSTVGPYAKYGSSLVEACVNNGVDYCDLTGEVQWIRRMIDQHHEHAKKKGVKIVHCCGFDSVPSDMGVYFLQKSAKEKYGNYCRHIKLRVKGAKGGPSGGTIASLNNVLEEAQKYPAVFDILENPYSLNPTGEQSGNDLPDISQAVFDKDFKAWIGPFIMAAINTKVVRRSHALAGYPYGKDFRYDEATFCGSGFSGKLKAQLLSSVTGIMSGGDPNSMLKKLANRFLPKPGEGPSKIQRETGYFNLALLGKLNNGITIKGKVKGDRDPGYGSTSKMLGESAVCLAKDQLISPKIHGVITPSTAMGDALLTRLENNAGLTFEIVD